MRLRANGIETALQLRDATDTWMSQQFGVVGLHVVMEVGYCRLVQQMAEEIN